MLKVKVPDLEKICSMDFHPDKLKEAIVTTGFLQKKTFRVIPMDIERYYDTDNDRVLSSFFSWRIRRAIWGEYTKMKDSINDVKKMVKAEGLSDYYYPRKKIHKFTFKTKYDNDEKVVSVVNCPNQDEAEILFKAYLKDKYDEDDIEVLEISASENEVIIKPSDT